MKFFSVLAMVFALLLSGVTTDADAARRIGGGKTSGMQRNHVTQNPNQAAPCAGGSAGSKISGRCPAAGAMQTPAAAPAKRSWMGPIAGLAAGLGLAALASHFGFGEELANMMMIAPGGHGRVGCDRLHHAQAHGSAATRAGGRWHEWRSVRRVGSSCAPCASWFRRRCGGLCFASGCALPAGFDVAALERQAKVQFIRLQAANDAGNLDDIREFTTPEMFAEVKMSLSERGGVAQQTDVLKVDAQVLDVTDEPARYVASVRFTGQIKDLQNQEVESFDEVWHLIQFHNIGVWQLAGIQQS